MRLVAAIILVLAALSPAAAQERAKGVPELQGAWKLLSLTRPEDDAEVPPKLPFWVIKGNTIYYGGAPLAKLTADPATTPKAIDLAFVESKRVYEAVYAVDGDRLKLCVNAQADGVKERPLDFTVKGKAERRLFIFERQKPAAGDGTAEAPGFVGIQIANRKDEGIKVTAVFNKSPAKAAGVKQDDIVLKVGGTAVTSLRECVDLIRQVRPGSDLTLRVRRGEKEQDITVRAGVLPFFLLD